MLQKFGFDGRDLCEVLLFLFRIVARRLRTSPEHQLGMRKGYTVK